MPRGKVLGGSSAINYLMYVRGSKGDYDGWASLGNKGWDWNGLAAYFKKHQFVEQNYKKPEDPKFMPLGENVAEHHGTDGETSLSTSCGSLGAN